jgi:hypothetical protein
MEKTTSGISAIAANAIETCGDMDLWSGISHLLLRPSI